MFLGIASERRRRVIRAALIFYLTAPAMLPAEEADEIAAILREIKAGEHLYEGKPPTDSSDAMTPRSEEA